MERRIPSKAKLRQVPGAYRAARKATWGGLWPNWLSRKGNDLFARVVEKAGPSIVTVVTPEVQAAPAAPSYGPQATVEGEPLRPGRRARHRGRTVEGTTVAHDSLHHEQEEENEPEDGAGADDATPQPHPVHAEAVDPATGRTASQTAEHFGSNVRPHRRSQSSLDEDAPRLSRRKRAARSRAAALRHNVVGGEEEAAVRHALANDPFSGTPMMDPQRLATHTRGGLR
jgi:hypothetical protein